MTIPPPEGLGADLMTVRRLVRDDAEVLDLVDRATQNARGTNQHVSNRNSQKRPAGETREYALRRLRRERPDLHAAALAGEKSAHGAMVEAKLPFGKRTAQRLMAIANHPVLSDRTHVSDLPASWGTLRKHEPQRPIGLPEVLGRHGGDRKSREAREGQDQGCTTTLKRGTADYMKARLRRDRPDLAERVEAGELSDDDLRRIELEENTCRLDLTPAEASRERLRTIESEAERVQAEDFGDNDVPKKRDPRGRKPGPAKILSGGDEQKRDALKKQIRRDRKHVEAADRFPVMQTEATP